ncbi:uncharacterized protein EHS24_001353 [Apiotrichum porosum]|uniref:Uncharacterized protein n=1 Tax=Apiotrichum porosum TaxID=105984 RepID=A0A427XKJ1_9TREE|nr:uncharacterized protein EHS24_001353 [Apiotrichum porosum]RSH79313.1 hypothetical protein EHS24_001353 [Apiotrichum porosum]
MRHGSLVRRSPSLSAPRDNEQDEEQEPVPAPPSEATERKIKVQRSTAGSRLARLARIGNEKQTTPPPPASDINATGVAPATRNGGTVSTKAARVLALAPNTCTRDTHRPHPP